MKFNLNTIITLTFGAFLALCLSVNLLADELATSTQSHSWRLPYFEHEGPTNTEYTSPYPPKKKPAPTQSHSWRHPHYVNNGCSEFLGNLNF